MNTHRGFSLIEVMVAVFVLSLGLMGMAALMATSMRNAQSANQRTQAINLGYEMIDSIRSNLPNAQRYVTGWTNPAVVCPAGSNEPAGAYPVATNAHALDLARWARDICYTLPNGQGRITLTTTAAAVANGTTYSNYFVVVDVCWADNRASELGSDCDNTTDGLDSTITVQSAL